MEPRFIRLGKPPKIVTVSFYPNESLLPSQEYADRRASMDAWGKSGKVEDYEHAYGDWISTLPQIPFYRDFNAPIFDRLGIGVTEFAWLPLIKCPLLRGLQCLRITFLLIGYGCGIKSIP